MTKAMEATGSNPFDNGIAQLAKAAKVIDLKPAYFDLFTQPMELMEVSIPVHMDNGKLKIFTGYRAHFNTFMGPAKGGIRYHWNVSRDEVKALAFWMSWKCTVINIPYGGGKGGIIVNPKELSKGELERLSRAYIDKLVDFIGPDRDIPAPDVYTDGQIMAWMLDEFEKLHRGSYPAFITGKPLELGGSAGRGTSTAQGGYYCFETALRELGLANPTLAVQGFGNAGMFIAKICHDHGFKVVAVSDSKGGIHDSNGLNIPEVIAFKEKKGSVVGFGKAKKISNEELLELPVDVLFPCALENQITKANAAKVKAKLIVELANGPTTPEADEILHKKGTVVVPDILANSGGVYVSYLEWVQNRMGFYWTQDYVFDLLKKQINNSFKDIWAVKKEHKIDMRTAAYVYALQKMRKAAELRGY